MFQKHRHTATAPLPVIICFVCFFCLMVIQHIFNCHTHTHALTTTRNLSDTDDLRKVI